MEKNKALYKASLLVALSGILYGFLGYFGTCALRDPMTIQAMLFWRFLIAGSWMLLFVLKNHYQQKILSVNKSLLFYMFALGALGYAGSSFFYFIAARTTGTGIAMVIFFSYPIMIAFFAWIKNRERLSLLTFFMLISIFLGLFLLEDNAKHPLHAIGILWALIAAASYAVYVVGSKKYSAIHIDSTALTTVVCLGCAFFFLCLSLMSKGFSVPHLGRTWAYLLAVGVISTALPIQLMLEGLKHISSLRASIISVLEPLMTVFIGLVLLHETISGVQTLGMLLVLGGALCVQFQKAL